MGRKGVRFLNRKEDMQQQRTFVMGDIHGAYKALMQCLKGTDFDYDNDVLIQLGDVVDGYGEVFECVEELLKIRNLIAIKGNHDDWFDSFLQTDYHPGAWNYGGKGTIVSYLKHAGKDIICIPSNRGYKTSLNSSDIPSTHRQFFRNQKLYHIDSEQRCFVHAGFDRNILFSKQVPNKYYWDRDLWMDAIHHAASGGTVADFESKASFREIFIGHTPTINWNTDKPMHILNITNLDTGAGHSGRLTMMDMDSKQYRQSDPLPKLYSENFRS
ncbi:metallophosphoesterase [Olivibacter sp. CPCC 100613]|uniref:metallophosphoesterase n=1 Tax=Olivibacter sp. CPCC 100613 TaxID=3079931 RepID=UPI002FFB0B6B